MTKDYKNVSATKKKPIPKTQKPAPKESSPGVPGWAWLLAGLVIGSFISFLVFLKTSVNTTPVITDTAPVAPTETVKQIPEEKEQRFKFYEILPNREVSVPVEKSLEPRAPKNLPEENNQPLQKAPVITKQDNYIYELQAGSFIHFKDADKRKANLAFLGIQAKIHTAKSSNNRTLYRVRIGPYSNIKHVDDIEKILKQNNIQSLLVKTRG